MFERRRKRKRDGERNKEGEKKMKERIRLIKRGIKSLKRAKW